MTMMRLFIALEMSESMCAALAGLQNRFRQAGIRGKYSPEENFHLTCAFLGEVPDPGPVIEALDGVCFTPFELELLGFGAFRGSWWGGVRESVPLQSVARRIRQALDQTGISFDKKAFRPHITLLRKPVSSSGRPAVLPPVEPLPASMMVERFVLFRSDSGKNGMIYTPLAVFGADSGESQLTGERTGNLRY